VPDRSECNKGDCQECGFFGQSGIKSVPMALS
jgi:hypothetical protein